MANDDLIQCGNHGMAPWSIVCNHLIDGTSTNWVPIHSDNQEAIYDWVCPQCEPTIDNPNLNDLKAICIHCVRKLRHQHNQPCVGDHVTLNNGTTYTIQAITPDGHYDVGLPYPINPAGIVSTVFEP